MNPERVRQLMDSGKRGVILLDVLGKQSKFAEMFATDLGKMILTDAVSNMNSILEKIINEEATTEEKAEFRALRKIISTWSDRISDYINNLKKV